jgi:hypothetical protein
LQKRSGGQVCFTVDWLQSLEDRILKAKIVCVGMSLLFVSGKVVLRRPLVSFYSRLRKEAFGLCLILSLHWVGKVHVPSHISGSRFQ